MGEQIKNGKMRENPKDCHPPELRSAYKLVYMHECVCEYDSVSYL